MKENSDIKFLDVVGYAEWVGFKHRGEESKATDWTGAFLYQPWAHKVIMVLYEGEKRILCGHTEPEVCWVCIYEDGSVASIPSRTLRQMDRTAGFGFEDKGRQLVYDYMHARTIGQTWEDIMFPSLNI